jgi:aryl-alcohol dehydrogenase-like predicted oxidoreductase
VIDDERFDRVEAFEALAKERGHTLLELAVSALASTRGMGSIIAGATRPEQVRANAAASRWRLTEAELDELAHV